MSPDSWSVGLGSLKVGGWNVWKQHKIPEEEEEHNTLQEVDAAVIIINSSSRTHYRRGNAYITLRPLQQVSHHILLKAKLRLKHKHRQKQK